MFVFIITALLLTVMTVSTADMVERENNSIMQDEYTSVADQVMTAIVQAVEAGSSGQDVSFVRTITVPREIMGQDYTVSVAYGQLTVASQDGSRSEVRQMPRMAMPVVGTSSSASGHVTVSFDGGQVVLG